VEKNKIQNSHTIEEYVDTSLTPQEEKTPQKEDPFFQDNTLKMPKDAKAPNKPRFFKRKLEYFVPSLHKKSSKREKLETRPKSQNSVQKDWSMHMANARTPLGKLQHFKKQFLHPFQKQQPRSSSNARTQPTTDPKGSRSFDSTPLKQRLNSSNLTITSQQSPKVSTYTKEQLLSKALRSKLSPKANPKEKPEDLQNLTDPHSIQLQSSPGPTAPLHKNHKEQKGGKRPNTSHGAHTPQMPPQSNNSTNSSYIDHDSSNYITFNYHNTTSPNPHKTTKQHTEPTNNHNKSHQHQQHKQHHQHQHQKEQEEYAATTRPQKYRHSAQPNHSQMKRRLQILLNSKENKDKNTNTQKDNLSHRTHSQNSVQQHSYKMYSLQSHFCMSFLFFADFFCFF
jgi:hypothetical protein